MSASEIQLYLDRARQDLDAAQRFVDRAESDLQQVGAL